MSANEVIKILMVEDSSIDAELEVLELEHGGFAVEARCVETRETFLTELEAFKPNLIISDFSLPSFDGHSALCLATSLAPHTPFLFVSGTLGEERAIESLKHGAVDYVLKTNLARLVPAVRRALEEARLRSEHRKSRVELEETKERLDSILASLKDAVWSVSVHERPSTPSNGILFANAGLQDVFLRPLEDFFANPELWFQLVHPEDKGCVADGWKAFQGGRPFDLEYRILCPNEEVRWVHHRGRANVDEQKRPVRLDSIAQDITERKEHEAKIARLNRIQAVMSSVNATIVRVKEPQALFQEACRIAVEEGGFPVACIGLTHGEGTELQLAASWGRVADMEEESLCYACGDLSGGISLATRAARSGKPAVCNDLKVDSGPSLIRSLLLMKGYRSMASFPLMVNGKVRGILGLFACTLDSFNAGELGLLSNVASDLAFALESLEKEERLHHLAYYDVLTGLPNRDRFLDRVNQCVQATEDPNRVAVLALDMERFSSVNESLGRHGGDCLLRLMAERLIQVLGNANHLARIGSDHFAALIDRVHDEAEIGRNLEENLLGRLCQPFLVGDAELRLSVCIGIALFPDDGRDAETLLKNAEAALRRAKQARERFMFYTPGMNERVSEKLSMENRLRRAIEEDHFVLHYQPKMDSASGLIVGAEALIRWMVPGEGLMPPNRFIPLLEETGMIHSVGRWALERAAADYRNWIQSGIPAPRIAVNVSDLQLRKKDFVREVFQAIQPGPDCGVDLEITESMLMEDVEASIQKLAALKEAGVAIAIDDFGTGYSSLSYLARLPVDALKIDRAFVIRMTNNPEDMAIVSTVITLAHALSLKVIGEGVETDEQSKLLRLLRCDQLQGFLFSQPLPREAFEHLILAKSKKDCSLF